MKCERWLCSKCWGHAAMDDRKCLCSGTGFRDEKAEDLELEKIKRGVEGDNWWF